MTAPIRSMPEAKRGRPRVGNDSKQITVRVDEELLRVLNSSAKRSGHSFATEVRLRLWVGLATKLDASLARETALTEDGWKSC